MMEQNKKDHSPYWLFDDGDLQWTNANLLNVGDKMIRMYPDDWAVMRITLPMKDAVKELGIWRVLWGTDIFINKIPLLKSIVFGNILVWILLFVTRK